MNYDNVIKGKFISRPNRFIAKVDIGGQVHTVHVKNTGRCRELLKVGCTVYLEKSSNPKRKTEYDLIAVEKPRAERGSLLINMDSQAPNHAVAEWLPNSNLFSKNAVIRREVSYGSSRFDFYVEDGERRAFLEVKGVTLEKDGVVLFPDAPTERGVKHLCELTSCIQKGYEAYVLFVIQMKGAYVFMPNDQTHSAFGEALRDAQKQGVKVLALDCIVTENSITIDNRISVQLKNLDRVG